MKWISLIFAVVSMSALGWLVWQLASLQERRALEREARERERQRTDSAGDRPGRSDLPIDEAGEADNR